MPSGTLGGRFDFGFIRKALVLETSQRGFHPQKELVLALWENDQRIDPNMLFNTPEVFKICLRIMQK